MKPVDSPMAGRGPSPGEAPLFVFLQPGVRPSCFASLMKEAFAMNREPIFDALRGLLGRGMTGREVETLDRAIDVALQEPSPDAPRTLGEAGKALIRKWEGCARRRADGRIEAYPDPASADGTPWTIGWGATGPGIGPGTVWTQAQCDARFDTDIVRYAEAVARAHRRCADHAGPVRCAGIVPLQHRRDRPGDADPAAQAGRSRRRQARIRQMDQGWRQDDARAGQPAGGGSGALRNDPVSLT